MKIFKLNRLKHTILFALLIFTGNAMAQNAQSYMSINVGGSIPIGDYGSDDINNSTAGFATTGPEGSIEGVFLIIDYFGIGGKTGLNYHKFDQIGFRESAIAQKGASDVYFDNASPYVNIYTVLGPYVNVPISEKFHITAKMLAGFLNTFSADVEGYIEYENQAIEYFNKEFETVVDFSYMLGVDFRYIVTDHFMLKANFESLNSKHTFSNNYRVEYNYNMFSFTVSAGIAF